MTTVSEYHSDPWCRRRHKARQALWPAAKWGDITRRPCCCKAEQAEGHHPSHSRPFHVAWVCRDCHRKLHCNPTAAMERAVARSLRQGKAEADAAHAAWLDHNAKRFAEEAAELLARLRRDFELIEIEDEVLIEWRAWQ